MNKNMCTASEHDVGSSTFGCTVALKRTPSEFEIQHHSVWVPSSQVLGLKYKNTVLDKAFINLSTQMYVLLLLFSSVFTLVHCETIQQQCINGNCKRSHISANEFTVLNPWLSGSGPFPGRMDITTSKPAAFAAMAS